MALPPKTSYLIGGTFNSAAPILVDGDTSPFQLDVNANLKVNVVAGTITATNPSVGLTGAVAPTSATEIGIVDSTGKLQNVTGLVLTNAKAAVVAIVDGNGNQITSFGGGTQYADDAASCATPTGTLSMGWDSVNSKIRALKVDANQNLLVDVANTSFSVTQGTSPWVISFTAPQHVVVDSGSVAVTQSTSPWVISFTAPQHVIVDSGAISVSGSVDVTDRAARLLGVVYGSQGQQLKQTATNFNTQVELATGATLYDARQIRALTSSDIVTAAQGTAAALAGAWPVEITDGTNGPGSVLSLTNSKPLTVAIVDGSGTQITSFGGGTQYADDAASGAHPTGTLSMGWDSANSVVRALKVDLSQNLYTDPQTVYNILQPTPSSGGFTPLQSDQSGNLLGMPGIQAVTGAVFNSSTVNGTVQYPNGTSTLPQPSGPSMVVVQFDAAGSITGIPSFRFEGSYDGVNWNTINAATNPAALAQSQIFENDFRHPLSANPRAVNQNYSFIIVAGAYRYIRINQTVALTGSGTYTPVWTVTNSVSTSFILNNLPVLLKDGFGVVLGSNDTTTSPNGLAGPGALDVNLVGALGFTMAANNPIFSAISDGTNGPAAVKPASTAALATDPALVVTTNSSTAASVPAQTAVGVSSVAILSANTARREAIVVNTGTTIIYLGLGRTPTTSAYHAALSPCSSANDGTGGTFTTDIFAGAINAIGSAASGTVCVTELT